MGAVNQMRVQFKPAQQRIALVVFQLMRFGQTTQAGPQPKRSSRVVAAEHPHSRHPHRIGQVFDHSC